MTQLKRFWPPMLLAGLLLLLFGAYLLDGRVLAVGDGLAQDFPLRLLAAQAWRQGIVPFWDPYGFSGLPLLAAIHVGVFFPGNLPFLLLPPISAMNVTVLLALWTGGLGAYALARSQQLSRAAAFASGAVFMGSGFMVAHIENLQMLQAAALLPAVLWAIARHHQVGGARYARYAAILLALQILAGHPQMVIFGGLVVVAYTLYLLFTRPKGTRAEFAWPLVLAGLLGVGLAALQLAPTLDFIPRTQRSAIGYDALVYRSLPPRQLISFWYPFFFGGYGTAFSPLSYWGGPHQTELACYTGLGSLVLALFGVFAWQRRPMARFWAGVVVVGGLLALGRFTPLYSVWAALPLLHSLPAPGRHLLETDLALAVLAGFGFEALREARSRFQALAAWVLVGLPLLAVAIDVALQGQAIEQRLQPFMPPYIVLSGMFSLARPTFWVPLLLWGLTGALVMVAVARGASPRTRTAAQAGILALLVFDLGLFALNQGWAKRGPHMPTPLVAPAPALVAAEARVLQASSIFVYPYDDFTSVRALRYPNWGGLVGVRSLGGYDAFIPVRYARLMGHMESTGLMTDMGVWAPGHHALDLLGMRTLVLDPVVAADPLVKENLRRRGFRPEAGEVGALHFGNAKALPRAWRVTRTASAPEAAVDAHVVNDPAFNPATDGYLDAPDPATGPWSAGSASATSPDFNTIELVTAGVGPGFVAVSESFDPGWRAYLDGPTGARELQVHCLDGLILGVEVPAGKQAVTLRYEPRMWRLGLTGSVLALLVLLAWGYRDRTRARATAARGLTPGAG